MLQHLSTLTRMTCFHLLLSYTTFSCSFLALRLHAQRSASETASGNNYPSTGASPPDAPRRRRRQSWRVPECDDDEEDEQARKPGGQGGGGGHFTREEELYGDGWGDQQAAGREVKKTQHRPRAAAEVALKKALARHILSQASQTRGFEPASQGSGGTSSTLGGSHNGNTTVGPAAAASGNSLAPAHVSPTLTSPSVGAGSVSASGTSVRSGGICRAGKKRERIAATPVWKRPVVPLSKPYVPVPRKDSGRSAGP